jgi:hypothetical protein
LTAHKLVFHPFLFKLPKIFFARAEEQNNIVMATFDLKNSSPDYRKHHWSLL